MADGRALLRARQFFEPRQRSADGWNERSTYSRDWEVAYRRRWQHDRIVRSTHGGFVFLFAFAGLCAALALAMSEPREAGPP